MTNHRGWVLDLIFGRWRSQILQAGVRLGVFEALSDGHKDASRIARELDLDPALGYRLLRALAAIEVLDEHDARVFSLTDAGRLLLADHPETLRGVTLLEEGPEHYALWKHLPDMVRDGRQNAFVREFGCTAFEYAARNPGYARVFDEAMSSYSSTQAEWVLEALEGFDFSDVSHLCDIGGGHGYMICRILAQHPHLRGTVLERPEVIEDETRLWTERLGVGARCRFAAGDMFREVPGADAYMMKLILHDWNDAECTRILRNIHRVAPPGARVLVMEHIIPGPDVPHFAKLFDIHMMCWGSGRERTSDEFAALLEGAGLEYVGTRLPDTGLMGVVEGAKP